MTAVLLAALVTTFGCAREETPAPAPAPAAPAPAPEPPAEPVLDAETVLMDAAKTYFPQVAQSNNMIPSQDVMDNLDAFFIIDIRSAEDFEAGHIPGSYHSAWGQVGNIMEKIPRNRPVVVACYSGQTSGQTVAALRMAGFDNAQSLFYGMNLGFRDRAGFEAEGTGMNAAADLSNVSSPRNAEEEIVWDAVKAYFGRIGTEGNRLLPNQDLYDALQTNPNAFTVVDIRRKDDFDAGHIEFSQHSAWADFGNVIDTLPANRPVVVACYSGQTSGQTVGILRVLGMDAYSLFYGVRDGWVERAGLPLVQ